MVATLSPVPVLKFFDADGHPLAGGKLWSYAAGTDTPKATYTDRGAGTANANPLILDADGACVCWLNGAYKLVLTNAADVIQPHWPQDNITTVTDLSSGAVSSSTEAALPAGAVVGTLYNVTDSFRGLWMKLPTGWFPLNNRVIAPELFGAIGDGVADDTGALQACITFAANNHCSVQAYKKYRITATITCPPAPDGYALSFAPLNVITSESLLNAVSGLIWGGGAGGVMLEILETQSCTFDSLICSNLGVGGLPAVDGVTGILCRNSVDNGQAGTHNRFGRIGVYGCEIGLRLGAYTPITTALGTVLPVDGYDSNFEDNVFDFLHFYGTRHPLLIDSDAQDLNIFRRLRSGGPTTMTNREYIIRVLRNGGGLRFQDIFARIDGMLAEKAAIDVQDGSIQIDQASLEGPSTNLVRLFDFYSHGGRYPSEVRCLVGSEFRDTLGRQVLVHGTDKIGFFDCTLRGDIQVDHDALFVRTHFFESSTVPGTYYGFTGDGVIEHWGTRGVSPAGVVVDGTASGRMFIHSMRIDDLLMGEGPSFPTVGRRAAQSHPTLLVSGTPFAICDYTADAGDALTVFVDWMLYRGPSSTRQFSGGGRCTYTVSVDSAGGVTSAVAGAASIASPVVTAVLGYDGAEYSSFSVVPTITVSGAGPYLFTCFLTQTNNQADTMHLIVEVKWMTGRSFGTLNFEDFHVTV